jgi:hypothetical protein
VGILKNRAANTEAANAGQQPAFEQEDGEQGGTAVLERPTETVKTVTREQVAAHTKTTDAKEPTAKEPEAATQAANQKPLASEAAQGSGASADQSAAKEPEAAASSAKAAAESQQAPLSDSKEVAVKKPGVIKNFLTAGAGMVNPLVDLKDAFKTAGIEVDYSTFPRLRVDAGCIASTEGKEAGDYIEIQVISYSPSWTVTTGTDGKESKEHVRFSDDGKVTNPAGDSDEWAGTPLEEYKAHLIELGFEKAAIKEYEVIYGIALDCQEADFPHLNEVVALSLAPESRKKFDSYKINRAIQVRMGRLEEKSGNPVVRWTAERVAGKERSYFNLLPSHGRTEPVALG